MPAAANQSDSASRSGGSVVNALTSTAPSAYCPVGSEVIQQAITLR